MDPMLRGRPCLPLERRELDSCLIYIFVRCSSQRPTDAMVDSTNDESVQILSVDNHPYTRLYDGSFGYI